VTLFAPQILIRNNLPPVTGGLNSSTTAWINAVVADGGSVSGTQQTRVDNLITGLKADSLFALGDRLWLYAGESDAHQAKIDIINLSTHTLISTPTLAAGGYTGDGSTKAINTNFNLSTGTNFVQNSSSVFVYDRTSRGSSNEIVVGGSATGASVLYLYPQSGGTVQHTLHDAAFTTTTNADAAGYWCMSRTGSSGFTVYKNNSSIGTPTATSVAPSNLTAYVLGYNNNGSLSTPTTDQIACAWFGAGLDATQSGNLYTRIKAYMDAWGV
jgi:hypothetical protein